MKKNLILIVVAILLITSFSACRKSESSESMKENGDSSKEVNSEIEINDEVKADDLEETNDVEATDAVDTNDSEVSTGEENTQTAYELTDEGLITPEFAKKTMEETAAKLMNAISTRDSLAIAEFVHPVKGVRFTPYTYVSVDDDVILKQDEIKDFFENQKVYVWGSYDGTGEEISLTTSQYYEEFINTADFLNAEKIGYNEVLSSGNMEENQFEVYENAIVVEYYFSGLNPDFGGADWQSLRLVFEQYENDWKLVGIIHNQMTI